MSDRERERLADELSSDAGDAQMRIDAWDRYGSEAYAERPTSDDYAAVAAWKQWVAENGGQR